MRRLNLLFLALATVIIAAQPVWAQRPGGRGGFGPFGGGPALLTQKSVQEELKLSDDQVKQATELAEQQRGGSGNRDLSREERQKRMEERIKANDAAIGKILNADQLKRFKQISVQQRGGQALSDPEVATALQLSPEQKEKIHSILEETQGSMREVFQSGETTDDMRPKLDALRKTGEEKAMGVLTPDQQAKWKDLKGEPFKGEISRPSPRGRGRNRPDAGSTRRHRGPGLTGGPRSPFRFASFSAGSDDADIAAVDREASAPRDGNSADSGSRSSASEGSSTKSNASSTNKVWDHVAETLRNRRGGNQHWRGPGWRHRHWSHAWGRPGRGQPYWASHDGSMRFGQGPQARSYANWGGPRATRYGRYDRFAGGPRGSMHRGFDRFAGPHHHFGGFDRFAGGPGGYRHGGFDRFAGGPDWRANGAWHGHRHPAFAMTAGYRRGPMGWGAHHGQGTPPWGMHSMWNSAGWDDAGLADWRGGRHGPERPFGAWSSRFAGFAPSRDGISRRSYASALHESPFHTAQMRSPEERIPELQSTIDRLSKELAALRQEMHK